MLAAIARKEVLESVRDGRFRLVAAAVLALVLVTAGAGWRQARALQEEREHAQETAQEHFRAQDDKNPHLAAHYGLWVFKEVGPLAFLDPGVDPHLGVSLKLEAHRRNFAQDAAARDGTALSRFGHLSPALVLQLLVPLLLFGLGFAAFVAERERGTLRQLASLGVAPHRLLAGKAAGLVALLGAVVLPAMLVLGGLAAAAAPGGGDVAGAADVAGGGGPGAAHGLARFALLALAYGAFYLVLVACALYASARASSSRGALVALLGFWVGGALVVPRAAADLAAVVLPLPARGAFAAEVRASLERGLPGGPARDARVEELTAALLERHGFAGAETLMDESLLAGLELQAESAFENEVLDHHFERLDARVALQERLVHAAAFVSPFAAIRALSSALAGTDWAHHRDFAHAAERHRRALVLLLDDDFARNAGAAGWDYRAGRDLWEKAPPFVHRPVPAHHALSRAALAAAALLAWLVAAWVAAHRAVRALRIV